MDPDYGAGHHRFPLHRRVIGAFLSVLVVFAAIQCGKPLPNMLRSTISGSSELSIAASEAHPAARTADLRSIKSGYASGPSEGAPAHLVDEEETSASSARPLVPRRLSLPPSKADKPAQARAPPALFLVPSA